MKLGQKIDLGLELDQPRVYFFVSTFCSKCIANRKILHKYLDNTAIKEVDISRSHPLLEELQPRMAPTIVVIGADKTILWIKEGVIGDKTGKILGDLVHQNTT